MTEQELDARFEIARAFLHEYIDRHIEHKAFGPQTSEEWLKSIGLYNHGSLIPSPRINKWRVAMGLPPSPKVFRDYHNGKPLPLHVKTMNHEQFAEYEKLLNQVSYG